MQYARNDWCTRTETRWAKVRTKDKENQQLNSDTIAHAHSPHSRTRNLRTHLTWTDKWMKRAEREEKNNTKTFVYGFSVLPIEKVVVATQELKTHKYGPKKLFEKLQWNLKREREREEEQKSPHQKIGNAKKEAKATLTKNYRQWGWRKKRVRMSKNQ